jgi:predicted N-acetyltransferase YhbS
VTDTLTIRPYQPADREACLHIFRSNIPAYFTPPELAEFAAFLDAPSCTYFVAEQAGVIVGCGGYALEAHGGALCWGMVDQARHKQGVGQALTQFRLDTMRAAGVRTVWIDTSHLTAPFFARFGFVSTQVDRDYYAPGLHRHLMCCALG